MNRRSASGTESAYLAGKGRGRPQGGPPRSRLSHTETQANSGPRTGPSLARGSLPVLTTMSTSKSILCVDADVILLIIELVHTEGYLKTLSTTCRQIRELSMSVLFARLHLWPGDFSPQSFIPDSVSPHVRWVCMLA